MGAEAGSVRGRGGGRGARSCPGGAGQLRGKLVLTTARRPQYNVTLSEDTPVRTSN